MEDNILGSLTKKKTTSKQPALSQTMPAKSSLATGKGTASRAAAAKPEFDINDIMADDGDNFDSVLASK